MRIKIILPSSGSVVLTDTRIKTAKQRAQLYELTDERGLHLSVFPSGLKSWQMRYRIKGKERTASLGKYPEVSLAEAREKREQVRIDGHNVPLSMRAIDDWDVPIRWAVLGINHFLLVHRSAAAQARTQGQLPRSILCMPGLLYSVHVIALNNQVQQSQKAAKAEPARQKIKSGQQALNQLSTPPA